MKSIKNPTGKTIARLFVPLFIVAVVAGIWLIKNKEKSLPVAASSEEMSSKSNAALSDGELAASELPDFTLEALSLDIEELKSHGLPILIDFGADSCIPCKEMAPVLVELNKEYQGAVVIKFVDVWKNQSLAEGFPVEVIPTQFFFTADGKPFAPKNPEEYGMQMYTRKDNGEHIFTAHQGGLTKEQILAIFKEMGVEV